ncbi:MAG TPA: energy transducer TonB [Chitinophagaceae bacterium]
MLEVNKILQADVLDIIFEGRNKDYGAYELRSNYKKRLAMSVIAMLLLCALLLLLYSIANGKDSQRITEVFIPDSQLEEIKEKQVVPPPVEPPKPKPVEIATIEHTVPLITHEEVKPDEMPPEQDELADIKIGTIDKDGDIIGDVVAPPNDGGKTGVIELPKKKEDDADKIWVDVQIESEYPGGVSAWSRFLNKNLPPHYTDDLVERGIQGRVVVMFIVDTEGNISEVRGIEGPKELWPIAEKVIRKSGKWKPANNNGRAVKSYKRQPIVFQIPEE